MVYLALALGIVFSAYWVAQLEFVRRHRRWSFARLSSDASDAGAPVSVVHPIKDVDYGLEENLEGWFAQDYRGRVEHIFSFQDPDDPAIAVVRQAVARHPEQAVRIIVNPLAPGVTGKSSNMAHGLAAAASDYVVFTDSDIRVRPDFLVKMVRPLREAKVGATTCGQMNVGGRDFPTRFFTFMQNCETIFNWAFLTRLGVDVGLTGAVFGMRRAVIEEVGGLARLGDSLLEDMFLGNMLVARGYRLVLGPFVECHVDRLPLERSINYARRLAIGITHHISLEMPAILLMLCWYWLLGAVGLAARDMRLAATAAAFLGVRSIHGLVQRVLTGNRILAIDVLMAPLFDLVGTVSLLASFGLRRVTWRGITYELERNGRIKSVTRTVRN
jgi:ceramide glucosyltransferase